MGITNLSKKYELNEIVLKETQFFVRQVLHQGI